MLLLNVTKTALEIRFRNAAQSMELRYLVLAVIYNTLMKNVKFYLSYCILKSSNRNKSINLIKMLKVIIKYLFNQPKNLSNTRL